jgi:hypothetical protein
MKMKLNRKLNMNMNMNIGCGKVPSVVITETVSERASCKMKKSGLKF